MRLGAIPICFPGLMNGRQEPPFEEWVDMACGLGLDGIELYHGFFDNWDDDHLLQVRRLLDSRGLAVSMFTDDHDLTSPDAGQRRAQVARLRRGVDIANLLGAPQVRVTAGWPPKTMPREAVVANVAAALGEALPYARQRGVWLALEDHPKFGTAIADFTAIIGAVASPDLKVNLDTSNTMLSGDTAVDLARIVADRVVHVHASDRRADLEHTVAGEGVVDFPEIFRLLKAAGFDGWISYEAGGSRGLAGLRDGLDYLRRTWEAA